MKVEVEAVDGSVTTLEKITELSFSQSSDAACDSLYVYFKAERELGEIVAVRAYDGKKKIFNGLCDCQRTSIGKDGFEIYIYARSSASLLIDNQAEPYTYCAPSAKQLCLSCAQPLGFTCKLPNIYTGEKYQVAQGVSCYGAINQFVYFCTGYNITVTPDNEICLPQLSENCKSLNEYKILSLKSIINRSEPITQINFKKSLSSNGYGFHTKAQYADTVKINKSQYVNLASFADWQRDYTVLQKLKKSYDSYKLIEAVVSGFANESLFQRFSYSSQEAEYNDYALVEKRYICDSRGKRTRLTLRKIIDVKENTYVD